MNGIIEKVFNAFEDALRNSEDVIDFMELVTPEKLNISHEEFSMALYQLQTSNKISGIIFSSPNNVDMWDDFIIKL